jgi:hypothetical protein
VFVPFNESELGRINNAMRFIADELKKTGDFPEEKEYLDTISNILSAMFLVQQPKGKE